MTRFDCACWICGVQASIVALGGSSSQPSGNTNTTQTVNPWSGQVPYLEGSGVGTTDTNSLGSMFAAGSTIPGTDIQIPGAGGSATGAGQETVGALPTAAELYENYTPAYYPSTTYAPETASQAAAITNTENLATGAQPLTTATTNFNTDLENGQYLNANPATGIFTSLANSNAGTAAPTESTLNTLSASNAATAAPGANELNALAGTNAATAAPGSATLQSYANGANLNSNPYSDATAQSIMSQVEPSIASNFIAGGDLNNPAAAYAVSQGVTSALAPTEYSNYQTQEGLQQSAANTLGSNYLTGTGLQTSAAGTGETNYLSGTGLQTSAATSGAQNYLTGTGLQDTAATGLSNPYQETLQNMTTGALVAPGTEEMPYTTESNLYNAGTSEQQLQQNTINSNMAEYNYNESLPYNMLANYQGETSGNYGGTSTLETPYYDNNSSTMDSLLGELGGTGLGAGIGALTGASGGSTSSLMSLLATIGGTVGAIGFSDRRVKTAIRRVGTWANGLPLYAFRYRWDDQTRLGFMADEVERFRPAAVRVGPFGLKHVDYALATL